MIEPLFGGFTDIEVLARIAGEKTTEPYALVAATVAGLVPSANADKVMRRFLHDGVLEGSAYRAVNVRFDLQRASSVFPASP
jgi:molybdopterin-containing oxidoreductase family iron-sulfur binding subunit